MAAWLVVACAEHVARGRREGFVQACHGKAAPLRRMKPGDWVVCYSPSSAFRGADGLKAFTALGQVAEGQPFLFDMGGGFIPWRRQIRWLEARPAPLREVAAHLELTRDPAWGWRLRQGYLPLSEADADCLRRAMGRMEGLPVALGAGVRAS